MPLFFFFSMSETNEDYESWADKNHTKIELIAI